MTPILTLILSYILIYKYLLLFFVVMVTAIAIPLPANAVLLAVGAFASSGYFSLPLSIASALAGNILGDGIDYFLARRYGRVIFSKLRISKLSYVADLEKQIKDNAPLTIFTTRFIGPFDIIVSLLAGIWDISIKEFFLFDTLGNAISISLVIGIGYVAGVSWQNFSGIIDIIGSILLALLVLFILIRSLIIWRRNKKRKVPLS